MLRIAHLEALESRIAPALVVVNPLADILAGAGKSSATIELSQLFDPEVANPGHTLVEFTLNLDSDPNTPGIQKDFDPDTPGDQPATIVIELFDDEAPLTVQNFLRYVNNPDTAADYLNTFFHRSVPGFIVQGGGFDRTDIDQHIDTFSDVHNEFSETRSNVRGTIAMAKTGLSPNTATSEWFVNLADNSQNLDNQNGGFTVFGQVIQGMDIMDRIAALPRANFGGALTDTPVQNFDADPDNNPDTPPPTEPKAGNLVAITGVHVTQPVPGNASDVTFSVTSINDATTGMASDLLTSTITGTSLKLDYAPGKSGVVNVTVHAVRGSDSVDEVFQVTVRPNLVGEVVKDPFQSIVVPGDTATVKVDVKNNGAANFTGDVTLRYYLSKADGFTDLSQQTPAGDEPQGTLVNEGDILIGQTVVSGMSVPAGGSVPVKMALQIPMSLTTGAAPYRLIVEIVPAAQTATEIFTDDNVAVNGGLHALTSEFGKVTVNVLANLANFGSRANVKLLYHDANDANVTFSLIGKGNGKVTLDGDLVNIAISGTNMSSILQRGGPGEALIHNIDASTPVGTLNYSRVDTTGYLTFSGGVKSLNLGDVSGDRSLVIGLPPSLVPPAAAIHLGSVHDLSVESIQNIASLTAVEWLDTTGAHDTVSVPVLGSLSITGSRDTAGTVVARGDLEADIFVDKGTVKTVKVAGVMNEATFETGGNVGTVKLGGITSSSFFAGVSERPEEAADFVSKHSIATFIVTGLPGVTNAFVDSDVAAAKLGTVAVKGAVDTASGEDAFGFVADSIASYKRLGSGTVLTNRSVPGTFDEVDHYSVKVL